MPHNLDAARERLSQGLPALVWQRHVADTVTPVGAALALMEEGRGDFLLESVEGGEIRGRYSLLGIDPDLVLRAEGDCAWINRDWRADRTAFTEASGNGLAALRTLLAEIAMPMPEALPPALACLVGYFGYETIALVEKLPRAESDPLDLPDMVFTRPGLVLVFDALTDEVFVIAPVWPSQGEPDALLEAASERIEEALRRLAHPVGADEGGPSAPRIAVEDIAFTPTVAAQDYAARVARAQDYIVAGDIFQVVLAQRFTTPFALPAMALGGALLGVLLVLLLAGPRGTSLALILAGIAISAFAAALTSLVLNLSPNPYAANEIVFWMMGSLADRSMTHVWIAMPFLLGGGVLLATLGRGLDALTLGEDAAEAMGINLFRLRLTVIIGTAAVVGASTAVAGAIGFVGLVMPHLLRGFVGARPGALLWAATLGGAAMILASDILVRLVVPDRDLKLGVVTALVGAPLFLHLIYRTRREGL